jgi:diketogulonate reductase-like aldo/keto reductase
MAYSPLGGWTGANVLNDPTVLSVAASHNKSAAAVALRWIVQQNISAVTSVKRPAYAVEDLAIFDFVLSDSEMQRLSEAKSHDGLALLW